MPSTSAEVRARSVRGNRHWAVKGSEGPGATASVISKTSQGPHYPAAGDSPASGTGRVAFPRKQNTKREQRAATRLCSQGRGVDFSASSRPTVWPRRIFVSLHRGTLSSFFGLCPWKQGTFPTPPTDNERCLQTLPRCPGGNITPSPLTPSFQARTAELSDWKMIRMEKKMEKVRRKVYPGRSSQKRRT